MKTNQTCSRGAPSLAAEGRETGIPVTIMQVRDWVPIVCSALLGAHSWILAGHFFDHALRDALWGMDDQVAV